MKINQLTRFQARRPRRRVGRGIAAGGGKTAGRGTKGQKARSGGSIRPGFEGGQNPLIRRLPKLAGFTSHRVETQVVYTGQLNQIKQGQVDALVLAKAGLIKDAYKPVKIIVQGKVDKPLAVTALASKSAQAQLLAAGGSFTRCYRLKRPPTAAKS